TGTRLHGRYVVRLCVLNHSTAWGDVEYGLDRVASVDIPRGAEARPERAAIQAGIEIDWLSSTEITATDLRRIEAFASTTDDQAGRFLGTGHVEAYEAGAVVTARWSLARTFYVIASGTVSVRVDDQEINVLGPGDHLGEIAAIDWGRDF